VTLVTALKLSVILVVKFFLTLVANDVSVV